jgi:hypothetical protein
MRRNVIQDPTRVRTSPSVIGRGPCCRGVVMRQCCRGVVMRQCCRGVAMRQCCRGVTMQQPPRRHFVFVRTAFQTLGDLAVALPAGSVRAAPTFRVFARRQRSRFARRQRSRFARRQRFACSRGANVRAGPTFRAGQRWRVRARCASPPRPTARALQRPTLARRFSRSRTAGEVSHVRRALRRSRRQRRGLWQEFALAETSR